MLFTSFEFLLGFLPLTFVGFFLIARVSQKAAAWWLAIASLVFYGWWDYRYVPLLLASILFNYGVGYGLSLLRNRWLVCLFVIVDVGLLGYFKYTDFFIGGYNDVAGASLPLLHIVLPLGISFFTFTQIAFLVDSYRGKAQERNFAYYVLFVTYFPHLIAGPVLHHAQMMPQFAERRVYRPSAESIAIGMALFTVGMAKKLLIADPISIYVTPVFGAAQNGTHLSTGVAWAAVLAYTFQLYFDFSGYSDMAVGLSRLFGVQLPINFNSPYKAVNISEFWRRWHMTLSQFLRDYLYIPLGGNRAGPARRYLNLLATMVLGGLWHGANWTYVVWGALHGAYLCANHAWAAGRSRLGFGGDGGAGGRLMAIAVTFLCSVVAWVFFRAESLHSALLILRAMSGFGGDSGWLALMPHLPKVTFLAKLAVAGAIVWCLPNAYQYLDSSGKSGLMHVRQVIVNAVARRPAMTAMAFSVVLVLSIISQFGPKASSPFLYFQF